MLEAEELALLVLAAGRGKRMRSRLPKVLHPLCGRPMLLHVLARGRELGAKRSLVVLGPEAGPIREALGDEPVEVVIQSEPLGTAHAVLQAREALGRHTGPILIMNGDLPLYRSETLAALVQVQRSGGADLALLTAELPDPAGFGRIVRGPDGRVDRIVEESEASEATLAIREANLGVYVASAEFLFRMLPRVEERSSRREFFLTDLVELTLEGGGRVETAGVADTRETIGINDRAELARAESVMRERLCRHWMLQGVSFVDPEHTYLDCDVEIGADSMIGPGCQLRAGTRIGRDCRIDAQVVIERSTLGEGTWIKPHSWIEGSELAESCIVGPSAHLRPGTLLEAGVRIGNFVEIKNSRLGAGTKADHLSYIGDADVGAGVTIGCGAITVNYDGEKKSRTQIGDGAFVGCNVNLIAPVRVEARAYVAAGSTVTQDVPGEALAVARARQRNLEGWRRRRFKDRDR